MINEQKVSCYQSAFIVIQSARITCLVKLQNEAITFYDKNKRLKDLLNQILAFLLYSFFFSNSETIKARQTFLYEIVNRIKVD